MTKTFYTTYGYYRRNVILLRHQLWSCQSCTRDYTHAQFRQLCTSCRKRRHVLCLTQKFVTILFIETIIPDWLHQEGQPRPKAQPFLGTRSYYRKESASVARKLDANCQPNKSTLLKLLIK